MQVLNTRLPQYPFYKVFDISKPQSPCLDCDRREVGCHGKCKEYQNYKVKLEKVREVVKQNKEKLRSPRSYAYKEYANNYRKGKRIDKYYT